MINWILGFAIIAYSTWMGYRFLKRSIKGDCSCGRGEKGKCCEGISKLT